MFKDVGFCKIIVFCCVKDVKKCVLYGVVVVIVVVIVWDLVNIFLSYLFFVELVKCVKILSEFVGFDVEVIDEKVLKKVGYGGVIGVG